MPSVSLSVAMIPVRLSMYASALHSLPIKRCRTSCCLVKTVINVLLTGACLVSICSALLAHGYFLVTFGTLSMLFQAVSFLGQSFLIVGFRLFCQKHFRSFFVEFDRYRERHVKSIVGYKSVFIIGIVALLQLFWTIGRAAYKGITATQKTVAQCRWIFNGIGLRGILVNTICHPSFAAVWYFNVSQAFYTAFFLYLSVWRILQIEANIVMQILTKPEMRLLRKAPEVIEAIRLRHADLCHVIETANSFVGHILAVFYGTGMTCVVLAIHGFIHNSFDVTDLETKITSILFFLITMSVMTVTGAYFNRKMHAPVNFLFRLDVQHMTGRGSEIVSTFLSRVQGAPIGFSVFSLFTVDTSTIIMIFGTLLTYAVVIVQFQPNAAAAATHLSPAVVSTGSPLSVTSGYTDIMSALVNTTGL